MSTTNLTAASQLRDHMTRFWEPYNFAKGKSTTVVHDLYEVVTERMAEGRVPPGQYVTGDFPVLSTGPTPHTP